MPPRDYAAVRKYPQLSTAAINELQLSKSTSYNAKTRDRSSSSGKKIGERNFTYWAGIVTQVVLTSIPVLFLVLAIITILLNNKAVLLTKDESTLERTVKSAIKLSPTVFPIIFAAITGRFLRSLGLFLLNRRVRLGTLERLLGSQSFFSSIERQFAMRGSFLLGIGITLLWAFSPLGGQSALRLLDTKPHAVSSNALIRYEPIAASLTSTMVSSDEASSSWPVWGSTYMTSLRTSPSFANTTRDSLGNVKIPKLDSLSSASAAVDKQAFTIVDHNKTVPYVSLLGVPTSGVPSVGNASFPISSQYLDVTCSDIFSLDNASAFASSAVQKIMTASNTFSLTTQLNATQNVTVGQVVSFNFTSINPNIPTWTVANCALQARNLDSLVFCVDGACRVDAVRNSTVGQDIVIDAGAFVGMFMLLPLATFMHWSNSSRSPQGSSMTEWWINDPSIGYAGKTFKFLNMSEIPLETFTTNLGLVLNTLWQASMSNQLLSGEFPPGLTFYDLASVENITLSTSIASVTTNDGIQYICNKVFASILIIISILLLVEALVSLVLMSINIAPDALGYVSSYTRDNVHFPTDEASHLDGLERSSAMKDVYAMLGDVRSGDEVGHIAFTSDPAAQPLRKGRLYD